VRVEFGDITFDTERRQLSKRGEPVHLSRKAYQLLALLVEKRPNALSKFEIHEVLWPKTFVAESNLRALVNEVRAAVGDSGKKPAVIRTVYGFGYAFSGASRAAAAAPRDAHPTVIHRLRSGSDEVELRDGENVLGRDRTAQVWIGDESVSRRHACITVSGETALLEDLGSKNGTFRGEESATGPLPLRNGDEVRVGTVVLRYKRVSVRVSTRTKE
jgi:DNA-binding winged helix-turn-helix (wHTH) protein